MSFETFVVIWWWRAGVVAALCTIPALIVHARGQFATMRQNEKVAREMSRLVECSLSPWSAKTAEERIFAYWNATSMILWVFFAVLFGAYLFT